ncbi:MAG: c-type cytochrome domain-containing protein, partial [Isosphaeraceae bacterium]
MRVPALRLPLAVVSLVLGWAEGVRAAPPSNPEAIAFFESEVRPLLAESCQKCHGATKQTADLRLDSREAVVKGGASGPAVVPGDPDASLLIQAVRHSLDDVKMPPKGKLPNEAIEALTRWVSMGAPWPESEARGVEDPGRDHWAFQPVKVVTPP